MVQSFKYFNSLKNIIMRNFNFGKLNLQASEIIERSQLSRIKGGSNGDPTMIQCDCTTSTGGSTSATCTEDLVNQGGNRCCTSSHGSGSQQSNCGMTIGG
jgi:natural product precursor